MPTAPADIRPDDRIVHPLDQLRGVIRRYVLADGLLTAGLLLIVWFWLGLALDFGLFKLTHFDWVLDAPKAVRVVALAALAALLLGVLVTRLALRLSRQFSYPALALVLEKRFPEVLGDRLITAVELADIPQMRRYGYSEEMIRATIDEARERVAQVPVETVFNWRRLRAKAILLGVFAVGTLLAVFAGYAVATGKPSAPAFAREFADVSAVWGERNLLLLNTPWPRQAHLELVDFPEAELRIGKDAAAPRVKVRAFRWVIADRSTPHGWRPLMVADLKSLGVASTPLPPDLPADAATWDVDRVETTAAEPVKGVLDKLAALAAKPSMSRTLRKLDIPDAVSLSYAGAKTRGGLSLTREPNNEFAGEVTGLKESVRFVVKAADFATLPRTITLVPPPMFARLTRTEYQPAYLFHPPPIRDAAGPNPERDFADLKGLRQLVGERDLSLTGDKSVFPVVQGTEFVLTGVADKPLREVLVRPKVGKLPGLPAGSPGPLKLTPGGGERDRFTLSFRGADRPAQNLEFEIVLVDDDGVTGTRSILVQVTEDQPPQVELAADVLRKQGNALLVTPVARVPFLTESKVRDDYALGKVEYVFTYTQVEAQVVVGVQAQALAGVWAGAPVVPGLPAAVVPAVSANLTRVMTQPERRQAGSFPLSKFAEEFAKLPPDTRPALEARLRQPTDPDKAQVVREVKFNNQELDAFDLRRAIPGLLVTDPAAIQPRYKVELNLVATDANYETGPKTGQNLEPIRLLVVSEAELLAEISKDEEVLSARLDDILKRLRDAQGKLSQTADRLLSPAPPPDVMQSAAVRAQDIAQDIGKAHDTSNTVLTEFKRLHREASFNALRDEILARYQNEIIRPLEGILEQAFAAAEEAHKAFQTPLAEGRRPDDPLVATDRANLAELIRQVAVLRDKLGEVISLNKIRDNLRKLINDEIHISTVLKRLKERELVSLYAPEIKPIPPVELSKGQKTVVRQPIDWKAFAGTDFSVRFEGPADGALKFPPQIKVADDKDVVEYELVAGDKAGEYTLRLVPSVGSPVEVKVKVR